MAEWIKKQDPVIGNLQETHLSSKDKQTQSEGMEDDTSSKWEPKESVCSHTHTRQRELKPQKVMRDKGGHYIMINGIIHTKTQVTLFDTDLGIIFLGVSSSKANKSKNKQVGPHQTEKPLSCKGKHQRNEKTTYWIREVTCKPYI